MTPKHPSCRAIESDLVATATGEAGAAAARRVDEHARECPPCRAELGRYRAIDSIARGLRHDAPPPADVAASRSALQARLADLKSRVLTYGIVPSPLGNILVARSEHGVSLVEYLGEATTLAGSRLRELADVETLESSTETVSFSSRPPKISPSTVMTSWRGRYSPTLIRPITWSTGLANICRVKVRAPTLYEIVVTAVSRSSCRR